MSDQTDTTIVDPKKVQLAEIDIENWLYANPGALRLGFGYPIEKWIGRQFELPSGVADLIGICKTAIVVVEVKNVELKAEALTQVCRYANDIESLKNFWNLEDPDSVLGDSFDRLLVWKAVVFNGGVTNQLMHEADALNVELFTFQVNLNLNVSAPWMWTEEAREKIYSKRELTSRLPVFDEIKERALEAHRKYNTALSTEAAE